jgi:UDP-N-acetylmuramoyl-tripeptide--D-alanyl-D-alanine ligase
MCADFVPAAGRPGGQAGPGGHGRPGSVIPLSLEEVRELCAGDLKAAEGAGHVTGVRIDSRRIEPGDLFVAVGAGAGFLDAARARGAAATLVPTDPFETLGALGRAVRGRSKTWVVGITGSTGKTSTKDILHALCAPIAETVASERSYNAELGVPLTLCRLEESTEVCIVELAMRGFGQIAYLSELARPDAGLITNAGPAHLALVGSLEGVVKAKSELLDALPPGGLAVVPDDFPVARDDLEVVRFGEPDARVEDGRTLIRFQGREVEFDFAARHQARNALAALEVVRHGLHRRPLDRVEVAFSAWRGEEVALPDGGLVIVDCWNANPISMRAALEHLAARGEGHRLVAVLGDMAELGADASAYHREIGHLARSLGVAALVAVGPQARAYLEGGAGIRITHWAPNAEEAAALVEQALEPGDRVLVKGSRAVGLETVADALTAVRT